MRFNKYRALEVGSRYQPQIAQPRSCLFCKPKWISIGQPVDTEMVALASAQKAASVLNEDIRGHRRQQSTKWWVRLAHQFRPAVVVSAR